VGKERGSFVRLQKIISQAGIASRREAENLILDGRVSVNGVIVRELGSKANPLTDDIRVNGKRVKGFDKKIYILLNKPKGCVTTVKDDRGRPTVIDLLKDIKTRVYPVGRLDFNTEGILLLTNDGDFAYHIAHPRHEISKTYAAKVKGIPSEKELKKLSSGVVLPITTFSSTKRSKGMSAPVKKTSPAEIYVDRITGTNSWLSIALYEGRKRQIKRMCEFIGHPVIKLKRIKYGFLDLRGLKVGEYRSLSNNEVDRLMGMAKKRNA
jgi:pseudouridine synthase